MVSYLLFYFVGEYLRWAHPDSKKERLDQKLQAAANLTYRAEHAVRQIETSKLLQLLAKTMGKFVRLFALILTL